ncbi:MAG TPA: DUF4942 domain-containing protein, partial [Candidatus Cloacimonadota bacterium]|nr:DUF4942 domain-containing protein [Candidatus Cloacimonadota bacterium]
MIATMLEGHDPSGMVILEPSAGAGAIVDYLKNNGAKDILACETNEDLRKILATKCRIVENDFFNLTSDKVSHINAIIGNPPFSNADKHILHAWEIAPPGCDIIMLCNEETLRNPFSKTRGQVLDLIEMHGHSRGLGNCFSQADRKTDINVSVVYITKPGTSYEAEFEGFFLEDDDPELQANSIMSYNVVRDLVNRYVSAIKLFDKQMSIGLEMNELISSFYHGQNLAFTCTRNNQPVLRNDFKKQLQRDGWTWIFNKMNLQKYATKGLKEDINKFVEQQQQIPFTMKNIYHMIDVVIGTTESRMDKALVEMFDRLTTHHDDNRYSVPGWKTNSHYLLGKKFIIPYMCPQDKWN